jgi:hypothetical protein
MRSLTNSQACSAIVGAFGFRVELRGPRGAVPFRFLTLLGAVEDWTSAGDSGPDSKFVAGGIATSELESMSMGVGKSWSSISTAIKGVWCWSSSRIAEAATEDKSPSHRSRVISCTPPLSAAKLRR